MVSAAAPVRAAAGAFDLRVHSTFTGPRRLLGEPAPSPGPRGPRCGPRSASAGPSSSRRGSVRSRPADTSARSPCRTGTTRRAGADAGRCSARSCATLAGEARRSGLEYLVVENLAAAREPSTMAMVRELLTDGDAGSSSDPALPRRRPHVRARRDWRGPRSVRLAARARPCRRRSSSSSSRTPSGDHHWPFTAERKRGGPDRRGPGDRRARRGRRRRSGAHPRGHPALRAGRRRGPRRSPGLGRLLARRRSSAGGSRAPSPRDNVRPEAATRRANVPRVGGAMRRSGAPRRGGPPRRRFASDAPLRASRTT